MLRYGFTETHRGSLIRTELDVHDFGRIAAHDGNFARNLRGALDHKVIWKEDLSLTRIALSYDFEAAARKRVPDRKLVALKVLASTLMSVCNFSGSNDDPLENVWIGSQGHGVDRRLGMGLTIRWPEVRDDGAIAALASDKMQGVAKALRYGTGDSAKFWSSLIYAQVDRRSGVTLETNPVGSCSAGTDGMEYSSEDSVMKLYQHNLYNHDQQFTILAGAIAIAHADELIMPS